MAECYICHIPISDSPSYNCERCVFISHNKCINEWFRENNRNSIKYPAKVLVSSTSSSKGPKGPKRTVILKKKKIV